MTNFFSKSEVDTGAVVKMLSYLQNIHHDEICIHGFGRVRNTDELINGISRNIAVRTNML